MPRAAPKEKTHSPEQLAAQAAGAERLKAATQRRVQLAHVRKAMESGEQQVGQDHARDISSTGPASIEPARVQSVEMPISMEKLEILKFMEEPVTVIVHDSTDPKADPIPVVWNDGISQHFIRGQEQTVKRKFIEVLARAKITTYGQQKVFDDAGNETYRMIPHTAMSYPFAVVRDENPRGAPWLKAVLAS